MKTTLIYNPEAPTQPIGWKLEPETDQDDLVIGTIRDLQFFGFEETYPEYNGLILKDESKGKVMGNVASLSWLQREHHNKGI